MIKWQRAHEIDDLMCASEIDWAEIAHQLKNSEELHYAITLFNWDDDITFPLRVLKRSDCDLGTLLYMFEMIEEEPDVPKLNYREFEQEIEQLSLALRQKWQGGHYPAAISHNGSAGEELIVEWKSRYSHYEVFPDEKPSDAD
uniref:DUF4274 domain-containing protein n=1 Tax=Thaumasiovibrio occultus TaxID=1891184 RepID=UPI000B34F82D|nr:DUF4274 domain-containing protein [Thaumasiovibrio occultus]